MNCTTKTLSILSLAFLTGCHTPAYRIDKNPQRFEALPLDVQETVRQGKVELGYSEDAAYLAVGPPHRVHRRVSETRGETRIWTYVRVVRTTDPFWYERTILVRTADGTYHYRRLLDDSYWHHRREREYEVLTLEFQDGRIIAIEELVED